MSKTPRKIYSPIRYAGGKTRAAKLIASYVPTDVKRLVSPFLGGASFELYLANTRHDVMNNDRKRIDVDIIGYDIFQPLVEFWNVILTRPDELADALAEYKPTKGCYTSVREELKEWWKENRPIVERGEKFELKNPVKFVAMYYFNHQYSYGPMFLGWPSSVYLKAKVHKMIIERVRKFKCPNLTVKMGDFQDVIANHNGDFIYADPPYYDGGEDNKLFKPLYPNCNFPIHHKGFQHERLRDLLHNHKGGFLLSYNDCPVIREWYKDYGQTFPKWHYSYSQGETRLGENRIGKDVSKLNEEQREELLFENVEEEEDKKALLKDTLKKESHEILIMDQSVVKEQPKSVCITDFR